MLFSVRTKAAISGSPSSMMTQAATLSLGFLYFKALSEMSREPPIEEEAFLLSKVSRSWQSYLLNIYPKVLSLLALSAMCDCVFPGRLNFI